MFSILPVLPGIGTQDLVQAKLIALNGAVTTALDQSFNIFLILRTQTIFIIFFKSFYSRKDSRSFVFGLDIVPKIDCRMGWEAS